jgi:lipopolysaccharide assembly protein A
VTDSKPGASDEPLSRETRVPPASDQPAPARGKARRRARSASRDAGERRTRISGAWAAVAATTVLGVALVDFIVENTGSVEIHFFSVAGRLSVAAALLAATLAGAAVVLAVGVARTAQLRLSLRHRRQSHDAAPAGAIDPAGGPADPASN